VKITPAFFIIYLASSKALNEITGKYFFDKKVINSSPVSCNREAALKL